MVLVGPFEGYEEVDGKYKLRKKVLRPVGLGEYQEESLYVVIPKNELREKDGKLYVDTNNPWIQTLGLDAERVILPRVLGNVVENIVPIATIEKALDKHRFYGYYVVFENGKPIEIRGAGIYERVIPPGLGDMEPAIPAILVKDITELNKDEFIALARYTPPDFLPILNRMGRRDIISTNIAEMLKRDPLAVKNYPRDIIEKYLIEQQDLIVKLALLENTPMMMKLLIEQLRSLGYDANKVSFLYMRYYEEKQEDERLEQMKKEEEKRREEYMRRLNEERQKQFIKEYEPFIKHVIGVTLPFILASSVAGRIMEEAAKTREKTEEALEEVSA